MESHVNLVENSNTNQQHQTQINEIRNQGKLLPPNRWHWRAAGTLGGGRRLATCLTGDRWPLDLRGTEGGERRERQRPLRMEDGRRTAGWGRWRSTGIRGRAAQAAGVRGRAAQAAGVGGWAAHAAAGRRRRASSACGDGEMREDEHRAARGAAESYERARGRGAQHEAGTGAGRRWGLGEVGARVGVFYWAFGRLGPRILGSMRWWAFFSVLSVNRGQNRLFRFQRTRNRTGTDFLGSGSRFFRFSSRFSVFLCPGPRLLASSTSGLWGLCTSFSWSRLCNLF
jgi:hypothetical protein